MVVFCLVQCLVQLGIYGLAVPHCSLQILQFLDVAVKKSVEAVALLFQAFAFVFESLDSDGQIFVLFVGALVLVVDGLDFHGDLLDLIESGIVHSLFESVLSDQFLDLHAGLLQVYFQKIDLLSQVQHSVLVDVALNPASICRYLCSFSARSLSCCSSSYFSPSSKMRAFNFW